MVFASGIGSSAKDAEGIVQQIVVEWIGMPLRVREIKRLAVKGGWIYSHTTGDHAQYYHPTFTFVLTIAGADHKELDKRAERRLRQQIAGVEVR